MRIDSREFKILLKRQLVKPDDKDVVGRCFNMGINTAIKLIEIHEEAYEMVGRIRRAR